MDTKDKIKVPNNTAHLGDSGAVPQDRLELMCHVSNFASYGNH